MAGWGKAASAKVARNVSFYDQEDDPPVACSASLANLGAGTSTTSTPAPKLEQEVKELTSSVTQLIALLRGQYKSSDTPKSPQTPRAPSSPVTCYKCGGRRHIRTDCPTKLPGNHNATSQSPKLLNSPGLS